MATFSVIVETDDPEWVRYEWHGTVEAATKEEALRIASDFDDPRWELVGGGRRTGVFDHMESRERPERIVTDVRIV